MLFKTLLVFVALAVCIEGYVPRLTSRLTRRLSGGRYNDDRRLSRRLSGGRYDSGGMYGALNRRGSLGSGYRMDEGYNGPRVGGRFRDGGYGQGQAFRQGQGYGIQQVGGIRGGYLSNGKCEFIQADPLGLGGCERFPGAPGTPDRLIHRAWTFHNGACRSFYSSKVKPNCHVGDMLNGIFETYCQCVMYCNDDNTCRDNPGY